MPDRPPERLHRQPDRQGRLLLDEMISARPGLEGVNGAIAALQAASGARTVLTFGRD